jgi:hypothetical protein
MSLSLSQNYVQRVTQNTFGVRVLREWNAFGAIYSQSEIFLADDVYLLTKHRTLNLINVEWFSCFHMWSICIQSVADLSLFSAVLQLT